MGNRLSKIVTRTGDAGETGLGDGSRLSKSSPRIHALGDVDELNAWIGMLRAQLPEDDTLQVVLHQIQHDLFDLGGELAVPGYQLLSAELIDDLEKALEALNDELPPLKEFILPGGNAAAAHAHMARTVCRRAERVVVGMLESDDVNPLALQYLNRLSDFLFVLARTLARRNGNAEILWKSRHQR